MTAIVVDDVSKRFGDVTAIDRASMTVEEGEIFGFLGPNGAGKSTMINVFLDFVKPDQGAVEILGLDAQTDGVEARQRMGVLPEQYALFERLTGRQHVELAARSKDVEVVPMELLDRVRMTGAADRKAGGYSKGMAQRLVLAMALVGEPDLLILDEPTTGLDPNGAKEMRDIIREENERGATVFFSSHILEQVEAVCDRVAILNDGRLVAIDTIEGLRGSLGGGTKLIITVTDGAEEHLDMIEELDGVESAWMTDDGRIEVTCRDDAKMDVVVNLHEAGVGVENFHTEEASLEDMFVAYTGGGR